MNHFDIQRAESLMRYAEFLKDMECHEYASDVINLLHSEIVGIDRFKEFDEVTEMVGDGNTFHREYSIHPEVKKYVQEQIKQSMPEVYETYGMYDDSKIVNVSYETLHPKLRHYVQQEIKQQLNN
ncbi:MULTISPECIES: hypothetical protein [unclassified Virgibacillus]|uniref:hypothetical protein n=1 Tax=unclassified Virgibacillus TaxID=2620237 RepID=UPI00090B14CF|nr:MULTISPECIES: hypothetical protein [unclassified Virgibacillus]API92703.1 hypothetical protein BKP57_13345 [Virgibacillus sp. 6R]MBS7428199.1 hypothetical protein [Virgibacillus sp. 19R1-5]